jgi:sterol desaturase/sphingolipid hydroxylase (fatty acid hydroxylase superfamily)
MALIAALGLSPLAVLVEFALGGAASVFNHANIALPQRADNLLRWLVVTPDMHRIHHSVDIAEGNRNFANLFPWWDRLLTTYQHDPALGQVQMAVGLAEVRASDLTLWKLLALPFRRLRVRADAAVHAESFGASH